MNVGCWNVLGLIVSMQTSKSSALEFIGSAQKHSMEVSAQFFLTSFSLLRSHPNWILTNQREN